MNANSTICLINATANHVATFSTGLPRATANLHSSYQQRRCKQIICGQPAKTRCKF